MEISGIFGIAAAGAVFIYFIVKNMKRPKLADAASVRTGISRWSYVVIGTSLVAAIFLVPYGTMKLVREFQIESNWAKATATVVENVANGSYKGRRQFAAKLLFKAANGSEHATVDWQDKGGPRNIGQTIPILYDAEAPDRARVDDWNQRWLNSAALLLIGFASGFFAFGAVRHVLAIKSSERLRENRSQASEEVGTFIMGKRNFFLSLRHTKSWRIIAEHRDAAGRLHLYESEPIWDYDPSGWAKKEVAVPILVDRKNPARGWIRVGDYFRACRA